MARKPRLHLPGGFFHVMLRGNGGQDIFFTNNGVGHALLVRQEKLMISSG